MEPAITVLVGVSVFIISQYILKLVLEPIAGLWRTKAELSSTVLFRNPQLTNASFSEETSDEIRHLGARLRGSTSGIPCYSFMSRIAIFDLPTKDEALKACHELNLLAYNARNRSEDDRFRRSVENCKALEKLGKLLRIETTYTDRPE